MMVELMEAKTSILHPKSIELKTPEAWEDSTGIKTFLNSTQQDPLAKLKNVSLGPLAFTSQPLIVNSTVFYLGTP